MAKPNMINLFAHKTAKGHLEHIQTSDPALAFGDWVCPELSQKVSIVVSRYTDVAEHVSHICFLDNQAVGCFNESTVSKLLFANDQKTTAERIRVIKALYADLINCDSSDLRIAEKTELNDDLDFIINNVSYENNDVLALIPFALSKSGNEDDHVNLTKVPLAEADAEIAFSIAARIPAKEIFELAKGQVINLKHDISQPFKVTMRKQQVGSAYLCQKNEKVQATFIKE